MRVIEPHQLSTPKKTYPTPRLFIFLLLSVAMLGGFGLWLGSGHHSTLGLKKAFGAEQGDQTTRQDYRFFGLPEFADMYKGLAYPNTRLLDRPPIILGEPAADTRLQTIALSRGYELQRVPVSTISKVDDLATEDNLLQPKAMAAWLSLKASAASSNIQLSITSGYRSIDLQRRLFADKLQEAKITAGQIASGNVDDKIVAILSTTTIPGYSRHHNGYTIDIECGNERQAFKETTCYKWLSTDNYLNAKKAGWLPSHPNGVSSHEAEPEPNQLVWVGNEMLMKE